MDTKIHEVMAILTEECGEVIQAISKCFRFGLDEEYSGRTNRQRLEEELGDLLAMIEILKYQQVISQQNLEQHKLEKFEKLKRWSTVDVEQVLQSLGKNND
jgi:NTP pyrophosphatase (non-canonical NTP hydrolase)